MLIRAKSSTILSQHLKPFLLIHLHTLVFAKGPNSDVFYHLRTLESKTPRLAYPQHSSSQALRVHLHFSTR
jgi:hypothetical protein